MTLFCDRRQAIQFLIGIAAAGNLRAQNSSYPVRPIRIVVPYPPAGTADSLARTISKGITSSLGQPAVVENHPGAGSNIGTALVAKAPADGYTLLLTTNVIMINPHIYRSLPFVPSRDFTPIAVLAQNLMCLAVHPSVPVNNIAEFIEYAKGQPNGLAFASSGAGSPHHLAGEMFGQMAGVRMVHVAYKGGPPAVMDTVAGHVKAGFLSLGNAWPFIQKNQLRVIAVVESARAPQLPDVPTVAETLKGFEVSAWIGLLAPAGTPPDVIRVLNEVSNRTINAKEIKDSLETQGVAILGGTSEEFRNRLAADDTRWAKLTRSLNLKLD